VLQKLKKKFLEKNIDAEIKVIYKTPRELYEEERDLQKPIHEKFTHFYYLDIQVGTVDECYLCLGHIHSKYSWKENEFSDYISLPKNNGYQALHTTIFVSSGRSSEIHIKTKAMETINECGTFYTAPENFPKNMISNSLKALDKNYYTSQQYLQELKTDVLQKKIIVFAHTGETIPLPKNSSAIDFAYLYDCDKAHLLKEVKIDGEGHPVTTILQNGQVVEPVYNKKSQVRTFWLNHIHTGIAKNYISNWLSRLPKKELYTRGMRALGHEYAKTTKKRKLKFSKKIQQKIIDDFPEKTFEEVVISVGKGIISPKDFFQKYLEARKEIRNESFFYSIIDGLTSMYFRIFYFLFTSNRLEKDTHVAKIKIQSIDRPGMLLSILQVISQRDFNVASLKVFSLRPSKDAFYEIGIEYRSHKEISELFDELLEVNGVKELTRA
jgi:guanosine-3',5'-bis(diphosphate) 3'-pyrophosphohydrolase